MVTRKVSMIHLNNSTMEPSTCIDCGGDLSDSFVVVEGNEVKGKKNETKFNSSFASVHENLLLRGRIAEIVEDCQFQHSESELDLCFNCTQKLIEELEIQLNQEELERKSYCRFLEEGNSFLKKTLEDLDELEKEDKSIQSSIQQIKEEIKREERQKEDLLKQSGILDDQEKKYFEHLCNYQHESHLFFDDLTGVKAKTKYAAEELRKLEIVNVHQNTFYVVTTERIATINGFRLGRLPDVPVDWEEINSALGQTALLIYTLSKKIKCSFVQYRLLPMGNRSQIQRRNNEKMKYPLYGSNDLGFETWLWGLGSLASSFTGSNSKEMAKALDDGMVALLQCLQELCSKAKEKKSSLDFPYKIDKDKIGGHSVRTQSNNEMLWTKALKHELINLNYLLAWVSSPEFNKK
eukprot:TRINITY_DN2528_c0_g1_i1.p1 TRINITY_DN2528_c0_g1~~TRINITY_DN2528_c0_g1_i1.p1  ORF type:complete len:407 (-),score=122.48 TRINITY_DN2528_c0_g1_i1:1311-2531(-)